MWQPNQQFGFGWQQQQWAHMNPTPQSTDPVEWAAKAAQWAQQKQIQDRYYQTAQEQQQQQQMMMQQMQDAQPTYGHPTPQDHVQEQVVGRSSEFVQGDGQGGYVHQQHQHSQPVEAPKPLFDTSLVGPGGHSQPQQGFEGGAEELPEHPQFRRSPHMGADQRGGEEGAPREHRPPPGEHFPRMRGPHGVTPRGDFHPRMGGERFGSPRGHRPPQPRFSPRGTPPFRPHSEGAHRSPQGHDNTERGFSSRGGPTEEKFNRGSMYEENRFQRSFPRDESDSEQGHQHKASYVEQLEAVKKQELEKEMELKRELERMKSLERQRQVEIEKKLELQRKKLEMQHKEEMERKKEEMERQAQRKREEAERAKQRELEKKRLEEAANAKRREEEELEKKRQIDQQLAQEIENKKREMERMLEQKERMERELMEKQAELGRMGLGGGEQEGWPPAVEDYQLEQNFGGQERAYQPTIPSWNSDPSIIPGLGELGVSAAEGEGGGAEKKELQNHPTQSQGPSPNKKEDTSQMMESLGKIVSQLQTLQGLTSSLKLLQTMPKEGSGGDAGPTQGGTSEGEKAAIREKELSEDTKRKVAALLANESDSDGEQEPKPKPGREGEVMSTAREFDGTYNVQPQVYGTYASEQYGRARDDPQHQEVYRHDEGPPRGTRYSKFDYDPHDEDREPRAPYGAYPPRDEGGKEGEHRYPRPPPTRPPPESREGYSHEKFPPYPGGRTRDEEEWRRGQMSPPHIPPRDFPRGRPPYGEPEPPIPPAVRARPPPIHPDDYRGPPPAHEDPYYHRPPPEQKRSSGIFSQMESIDYSHGGGGGGGASVKSVDYNHGTPASQGYPPVVRDVPPVVRDLPPGGANFQYGGGYAGVYGEGVVVPGPYMQFGAPVVGAGGGYMSGAGGLDPAAIFAAYQGGESKRRTLPLWLREELEKLERKKAKQMEKEAREEARGDTEGRPRWADELDREGEREGEMEVEKQQGWQGRWGGEEEEEVERETREKGRFYRQQSHSSSRSGDESPPQRKKRHYEPPEESEEDRHLGLVMKIRQMLTEVLLEVTNQEIETVATESIEEAKKPKLVIQMKGMANLPSIDNRQLPGLGVYSSDSDSDADGSPDSVRSGKTRGKDGKTGKNSKTKSSKDTAASKIPKPEEIAAAFKDTTSRPAESQMSFMPVPRVLQGKQKESGRASGGSSSGGSSLREKEKEKKKSKDKYGYEESYESSKGEREREKGGREKDHKKRHDRDHETDNSSVSSSRKKSSSTSSRKGTDKEREKSRRKEKERDRDKEHGHGSSSSHDTKPSPGYSGTKSRRSSGASSAKSKMRSSSHPSPSRSPPIMSSRSRSPVQHVPTRIVEITSQRMMSVPTGRGSIKTTKPGFVSSFQPGLAPFGTREIRNRSPSPDGDMSYRLSSRRNVKSTHF